MVALGEILEPLRMADGRCARTMVCLSYRDFCLWCLLGWVERGHRVATLKLEREKAASIMMRDHSRV